MSDDIERIKRKIDCDKYLLEPYQKKVIYKILDKELAKEPQECEWKIVSRGFLYYQCICGCTNDISDYEVTWKKCPYCGKEIKVIEND